MRLFTPEIAFPENWVEWCRIAPASCAADMQDMAEHVELETNGYINYDPVDNILQAGVFDA